jgi:hypothetical protein
MGSSALLRRVNDGSEFAYFLLFGGEEMGRMADAACGGGIAVQRRIKERGKTTSAAAGSEGQRSSFVVPTTYLHTYFGACLKVAN